GVGTRGHDRVPSARGGAHRPVVSEGADAASLGQEHTFDVDTGDLERLRHTLLELCDAVSRRLRQHTRRARTVTLKYREEDFATTTSAETLRDATDSDTALIAAAYTLFRQVHRRRKVRALALYRRILIR